jgi:hypothetical protein
MLQLQRVDRFLPYCEERFGTSRCFGATEATLRRRTASEEPPIGYYTPSTTAVGLRSWRSEGIGIARQRVNAPASSADDSG